MLCEYCGKEIILSKENQKYCDRTCANKSKIHLTRQYDYSKTVWSCGGGVQSTAIAALIYSGKLQKPDYSIMVDVGMERQSTWEYVNGFLINKLKEIGIELVILKTKDYYGIDLFHKNCLLIPAYRLRDGVKYKMKTMCNDKWKVRVSRNYLKSKGLESYINWIGISKDEERRARCSNNKCIIYNYPLVNMGITKYGCIELIKNLGWKIPPKTSCWCCPSASDAEWFDMKMNYPDDWTKAIQLEKYIRSIDSEIYLCSSMKTLEDSFS